MYIILIINCIRVCSLLSLLFDQKRLSDGTKNVVIIIIFHTIHSAHRKSYLSVFNLRRKTDISRLF